MLDTLPPPRPLLATASPIALVRGYLRQRGDDLAVALERLGGMPAFARLCRLREHLQIQRPSLRRIEGELQVMLDLLSLRHVHDLDRAEAALFGLIDPSSEGVHDMCRLSEEIGDLLRKVRRLQSAGTASAKVRSHMSPRHPASDRARSPSLSTARVAP